MTANPYELLGVSKDASEEDIKKAFKRKAIEFHPDKTAGDKDKEDKFKEINEAYSILSDPEKRKMYDLGLYDQMHGGGGPGPDMNHPFGDIFASFFGSGMGGAEMPFGFSFGPGGPTRRQQRRVDFIGINLNINDLYYGTTKKIEFELLDKCGKCNGTGANDPSHIVKCMTCNGTGMAQQRITPFMISAGPCFSCQGKGEVRTGKACGNCKGDKTVYKKRTFELNLPKGISDMNEVHMERKGAYDVNTGENNDIVFKLNYHIPSEYQIDAKTGNVEYTIHITIDDLLGGFEKTVTIYNEKFTFVSDGYFNPNNTVTIEGKGLLVAKTKKQGDLYVKFVIDFTEGERLIKYKEILRKIYKRQPTMNHASSSESESRNEKGFVYFLTKPEPNPKS